MIYGNCKIITEAGIEYELYVVGGGLFSYREDRNQVMPLPLRDAIDNTVIPPAPTSPIPTVDNTLARISIEAYILEDGKPVILQPDSTKKDAPLEEPKKLQEVIPNGKKRKLDI